MQIKLKSYNTYKDQPSGLQMVSENAKKESFKEKSPHMLIETTETQEKINEELMQERLANGDNGNHNCYSAGKRGSRGTQSGVDEVSFNQQTGLVKNDTL